MSFGKVGSVYSNKVSYNDIANKIKIISATLPNTTGSWQIYEDTSLYNNYIIAGYTVLFGPAQYTWFGDEVISDLRITSTGLTCSSATAAISGLTIKIVLIKYT